MNESTTMDAMRVTSTKGKGKAGRGDRVGREKGGVMCSCCKLRYVCSVGYGWVKNTQTKQKGRGKGEGKEP